jgi:hypothetical protein
MYEGQCLQNQASELTKVQPQLLTRVSQLQQNNKQLNIDVTQELNTIRERISSIGYRINPESHPSNKPLPTSDQKPGVDMPSRDGLQADLDGVIDESNRFIVKFLNDTLPGINVLLAYIEQHI